MKLDNSALLKFQFCPAYYQERYVNNIDAIPYPSDGPASALDFGSAFHRLLEVHFKGEQAQPELWDGMAETLRDECDFTFERYKAQYPEEPWNVVDVERLIEVPLSDEDSYTGKLDLVVRRKDNGLLSIIDHKTEDRGSLNNLPQKWQYNTQVSLYQWAAEQIYNEPIYSIGIDIIQRRSPAGRCDPEFRRLDVNRSRWQQEEAVRTLRYVVKQIKGCKEEFGNDLWPQNRDNCQKWRIPCAFAKIHGEEGRDENILKAHYKEAEDYLHII